MPDLPRVGLTMRLGDPFESMAWFGRGPHENYIDRKAGARVGLFTGTVTEQYEPYIFPQEYGNKSDVRWVALQNDDGAGLLAVADGLIEVSAHRYALDNLTAATHTCDLVRLDAVVLNLDYRQGGIGSASCGPEILPQYLLRPEPVKYAVWLRPSTRDDGPLHELARQHP
jgi:beta-galactosidase